MRYKKNPTRLEVYMETRKRRMLAGILEHDIKNKRFIFTYEYDYLHSKSAFSIGPEFPITRQQFISENDTLFPTFEDRIPDKQNPAYNDYCYSQGIKPDESNSIILLGSIGHRGPSCFIYEAIYEPQESTPEQLKSFREKLELTQWDFAMLFDFSQVTIQKVEAGKTKDKNILRLIDVFITNPTAALEQMRITGKKTHRDVRDRVYKYFKTIEDEKK